MTDRTERRARKLSVCLPPTLWRELEAERDRLTAQAGAELSLSQTVTALVRRGIADRDRTVSRAA
jgi:hypothetical protein